MGIKTLLLCTLLLGSTAQAVRDTSFYPENRTDATPVDRLSNYTSCPEEVLSKTEAQYIFIGESHPDGKPISFFETTLPILKNKGFEYFFAEYFASIDQPIIDKYFYKEGFLSKIFLLFSDWGWNPLKYEMITSLVQENEFSLIALDRRRDLRINMDPDEKMARRDFHMFKIAVEFIDQNPDAKIIFYNGSSHSHINTGLPTPSFYAAFKEYYPDLKTINIKIDDAGYYSFSPQKKKINFLNSGVINLGCKSGTFFFNDPDTDEFNFYGYQDNSPIYPIQDNRGVLL